MQSVHGQIASGRSRRRLRRSAHATRRGASHGRNPALRVFLPDSDPERSQVARELEKKLAKLAIRQRGRRSGLLIGEIDDVPARDHFLAHFFKEAGFVNTALGFQMRRIMPSATAALAIEGDVKANEGSTEKEGNA